MPEDVERLVKKLEKKPEIEEPWALATWMKKKGYKMPEKKKAEEEALPTEKDWKEYNTYKQKIEDRRRQSYSTPKPLGSMKAEEDVPPLPERRIREGKPPEARPPLPKYMQKKAEEEPQSVAKTPKEHMESYTPKGRKPTYIDTKPSGKGKSLEEWASEKNDPLVYPDEFKMGMKEEMEHADTVGKDKETIKKIVLDHLKEDPHYYTKLGTVMKAEESTVDEYYKKKKVPTYSEILKKTEKSPLAPKKAEEEVAKELDVDGLNELFQFMKWMTDKGFKADEKDKFEQYMDQYDVEKFAEEMKPQSDSDKLGEEKEAPAKFHADPEVRDAAGKEVNKSSQLVGEEEIAGLTDTIKKVLNPKPEMPKQDNFPPLTKKIVRKVSVGAEEGLKETIKKILNPAPPKLKDDSLPPLTKKTMRNVVRKTRSGV